MPVSIEKCKQLIHNMAKIHALNIFVSRSVDIGEKINCLYCQFQDFLIFKQSCKDANLCAYLQVNITLPRYDMLACFESNNRITTEYCDQIVGLR